MIKVALAWISILNHSKCIYNNPDLTLFIYTTIYLYLFRLLKYYISILIQNEYDANLVFIINPTIIEKI